MFQLFQFNIKPKILSFKLQYNIKLKMLSLKLQYSIEMKTLSFKLHYNIALKMLSFKLHYNIALKMLSFKVQGMKRMSMLVNKHTYHQKLILLFQQKPLESISSIKAELAPLWSTTIKIKIIDFKIQISILQEDYMLETQ